MSTDHKLFFAIPFDAATRCLYERICRKVRKRYPGVTTEIGSDQVGPSPEYSTIASFKAQNRELTSQFVAKIRDADIVIADLTHNNPNVHVELGIALLNNKNVLRVTGRSLSELGFDIRNYEVSAYKDEAALTKTIIEYCEMFFKIKELAISSDYGSLYYSEPCPVRLQSSENRPDLRHLRPGFTMRDGGVRLGFKLIQAETDSDWVGVYFRVGIHPFWGSYLLYVRKNGSMEIASYPGPKVLATLDTKRSAQGRQELIVEFENNHLHAQLGETHFRINSLSHQTAGGVWLAAWNATVAVDQVEMICRDTIEWD